MSGFLRFQIRSCTVIISLPKKILQNLPGCSSAAKSDNSVSEGVVDLSRFILRLIGCMAITSYLILIELSQTRYYTVNISLPQTLPNTRNVFTASILLNKKSLSDNLYLCHNSRISKRLSLKTSLQLSRYQTRRYLPRQLMSMICF